MHICTYIYYYAYKSKADFMKWVRGSGGICSISPMEDDSLRIIVS